jgi:hypothetical protein
MELNFYIERIYSTALIIVIVVVVVIVIVEVVIGTVVLAVDWIRKRCR